MTAPVPMTADLRLLRMRRPPPGRRVYAAELLPPRKRKDAPPAPPPRARKNGRVINTAAAVLRVAAELRRDGCRVMSLRCWPAPEIVIDRAPPGRPAWGRRGAADTAPQPYARGWIGRVLIRWRVRQDAEA